MESIKKKKFSLKNVIFNTVFIIGSLIYLVPFLLALLNSFKTAQQAQALKLSIPTEFHFENYATVIIEGDLLRAAMNGLLYSVITVLVVLPLCGLTAFILIRRKSRISTFIHTYFMLGIVVPSALIPTFLILKLLGLLGKYPGLIFIYICGAIPMAIFLYGGFINTIPEELDEAAIVDGAGLLRTFFTIIFPLLKPITATVAVLTFMNVWNDFSNQLYFGSIKMRAMPLSVYSFFGKYSQSWNLVFADIVLTIIPIVIVYAVGQKYIISGMTAGAVKG